MNEVTNFQAHEKYSIPGIELRKKQSFRNIHKSVHFSITLMKGGHRFLISVPSQSLISYPPISNGVIRIIESNQGQKGGCFHNLCRIMADSKKGKKWKEMM